MSFQHRYVVGHVTREALVTERGNPGGVVVLKPVDRDTLNACLLRHCDPGSEAAPTLDGFPMVDHGEYVEVLIFSPGLLPHAAAFAVEMHEKHGCDVADIGHGRDPIDPRSEWGDLLEPPPST